MWPTEDSTNTLASPRRQPTLRQRQRRESILETARTLIVERGYDGVAVRELARRAGVTTRTLYQQFGSRERLLRVAVEDRFRSIYEDIDAAEFEHGFDRLLYIVDRVAETTRANIAYATALKPLFLDPAADAFTAIRMRTYRRAVLQIAGERDFLPWVNVEQLADVVCRQVNPIYNMAWLATVPPAEQADVVKLDVALVLGAVSQGYTRRRALETVRGLQRPR